MMDHVSNEQTPGESAQRSTRVLVVDGSQAARHSASALLSSAGYEVELACDGFEALSCIAVRRPDAVIVDTLAPRLDGYQLCALLKSNTDYRAIPVIIATGKDGTVDTERASLVGSNAHLCKPFTAQLLDREIGKLCHLAEGHSEQPEAP